jgi:hypothetical protein
MMNLTGFGSRGGLMDTISLELPESNEEILKPLFWKICVLE